MVSFNKSTHSTLELSRGQFKHNNQQKGGSRVRRVYIYTEVFQGTREYTYIQKCFRVPESIHIYRSVSGYQRVCIYTEVFQGTREYTYIQKCFKVPESIHIYKGVS